MSWHKKMQRWFAERTTTIGHRPRQNRYPRWVRRDCQRSVFHSPQDNSIASDHRALYCNRSLCSQIAYQFGSNPPCQNPPMTTRLILPGLFRRSRILTTSHYPKSGTVTNYRTGCGTFSRNSEALVSARRPNGTESQVSLKPRRTSPILYSGRV